MLFRYITLVYNIGIILLHLKMNILKVIKDWLARRELVLFKGDVLPAELFDLYDYFRFSADGINFAIRKDKDSDMWVAESVGFRQGSIITTGRTEAELEKNMRDAILTAFSIPSSYMKEAKLVGKNVKNKKEYVFA